MCDCGTSGSGKYLGKIGGQIGDRFEGWGRGVLSQAQKKFKSWTGLGDYKLVSNSLVDGYSLGENMSISSQGRATVIRYREYLGEVTTGATIGAFTSREFTVNPANVVTFPWLAPIAQQFDQYKPLGVIFEFRSTASDSTTNASVGSVLMATDYDAGDSGYETKAQMLNSAYSSEAKASDDMVHGLECDPSELQRTVFYTRRVGATVDNIRDYDLCRTTVATSGGGLPANQSVGSLYVNYEFAFYKEELHGGLQQEGQLWQEWNGQLPSSLLTVGAIMGLAPTTGIDMGLRFLDGTGITIPARWAGATFEVRVNFSNSVSRNMDWAVAQPTVAATNLAAFNLPTATARYSWASPETTALCKSASGLMYFRLFDTVPSTGAVYGMADMIYPTWSGFADTLDYSIVIRVVPRNLYDFFTV